jgi:hypothetical protein
LAQPSDEADFDTRFKQQCQQDYITIKSIYNKIIPKVVTMDELKEAIKVINNGLSIENIIFAGEEFLHHLLDLIGFPASFYCL